MLVCDMVFTFLDTRRENRASELRSGKNYPNLIHRKWNLKTLHLSIIQTRVHINEEFGIHFDTAIQIWIHFMH